MPAAARAVFPGPAFRGQPSDAGEREKGLRRQTVHVQNSQDFAVEAEGGDESRNRKDKPCKADFGHDLECWMYPHVHDDRSKLPALPNARRGAAAVEPSLEMILPCGSPDAMKASSYRQKEGGQLTHVLPQAGSLCLVAAAS